MRQKGIDVSTWQEGVDWEKVKADGVEFAMLRASFGRTAGQVDSQFEAHYKGAKAAGIPVGAYHYSYARNVEQAEKEADLFLSTIRGKVFEYPLAFDIEDKTQSGLGKQLLTDIVLAFCNKVQKAGYYVMVYTNLNWLENKLDYNRFKQFDVWAAQYWSGDHCQFTGNHGMWQYSSEGRVKGIAGNVDTNWAYKDYPSIIREQGLNGLTGGNAAPAPSPAPTPKPQPSAGIKVGDKVTFTGGAVYASSSAAQVASNIKGSCTCKVTHTAPGAKHPYHLEGGKVYGWVNSSSVKAGTSGSATQGTIKKGDRVRIRKGAADYTGKSLAAFVYERVYPVDELKGDRAVLDLKGICTAVHTQDLIKV